MTACLIHITFRIRNLKKCDIWEVIYEKPDLMDIAIDVGIPASQLTWPTLTMQEPMNEVSIKYGMS